ncbi:MAG: hypothetical protein HOE90_18765 [Bacteriovoracaceae bacterium]|nr:hypothetical protein [Bacteriovoracaceae bacterium]
MDNKLLILLIIAVIVSGCSKIDEFGEQSKAIGETATETKGYAKESVENTGMVLETSAAMYADVRKSSVEVRNNAKDDLIDKQDPVHLKIRSAAIYFNAMEFQYYKPFLNEAKMGDDEARFDKMKKEAMDDLFRIVSSQSKYIKMEDEYEFDVSSPKNEDQNIFALAVTLHKLNSNQQTYAEKTGQPTVTVLSLLKEGLELDYKKRLGLIDKSQIPAYADTVSNYRKYAIYLLRARHNFLAAMALARISYVKVGSGLQQLFTKLGMLTRDWPARTEALSEIEMYEITKWLEEAETTKQFLESINVPTELCTNLGRIYDHLLIVDIKREYEIYEFTRNEFIIKKDQAEEELAVVKKHGRCTNKNLQAWIELSNDYLGSPITTKKECRGLRSEVLGQLRADVKSYDRTIKSNQKDYDAKYHDALEMSKQVRADRHFKEAITIMGGGEIEAIESTRDEYISRMGMNITSGQSILDDSTDLFRSLEEKDFVKYFQDPIRSYDIFTERQDILKRFEEAAYNL